MQPSSLDPLPALLLQLGRAVVLQLDDALAITQVHNPLLLAEWRDAAARTVEIPATLPVLLDELMGGARARDLAARIEATCGAAMATAGGIYLGVLTLRASRGGGTPRHAAASLHGNDGGGLLLVLRDVSALADVQQLLADTQLAFDTAMCALRSPPHALRIFLGSALTSISAIRLTLRMPARDTEALRDKLVRVHAAVAQLDTEAAALSLAPLQDACQAVLARLNALQERDPLTGDALLPLATLVDRIAACAGMLWRIEEQRHVETPPASRTAARAGRQPDWSYASERRWASFLRHRGEELGVLVSLRMLGAAHVPRGLRVSIDDLLQHLLRNAVEHGIETPEERLAAGKPASATIEVKFELRGGNTLCMTVRDDGRGRGLGLTFLRRAVARLGGEVAVAAKPGEYTQFIIDLPREVNAAQQSQVAAQ